LHAQYNQYYEDTGQTAPAALDVMSRWWEETAYRAYATVQYGDESHLGLDYAACQQLETNAGIDAGDRHAILAEAYASGDEDYSAAVPAAGSPMINGGDTDQNLAARQNLAWGLCQADTDGNYTLRSDLPAEGIEGGKIGGPITPGACTAMFTGEGVQNKPGFVLSLPFSDTVSPDKTVKEVTAIQFSVFADDAAMGFFVRYTSGVICAPMTADRAEALRLPPMVADNEDPKGTAYTVSCDAVGVTTGISAAERGLTGRVLAAAEPDPAAISRPGHVFPLIAKAGGVRQRPGHTEAGVEFARLAGAQPVAMIGEVVHDDGSMMRFDAVRDFADANGLVMVSIEQLIAYLDERDAAA